MMLVVIMCHLITKSLMLMDLMIMKGGFTKVYIYIYLELSQFVLFGCLFFCLFDRLIVSLYFSLFWGHFNIWVIEKQNKNCEMTLTPMKNSITKRAMVKETKKYIKKFEDLCLCSFLAGKYGIKYKQKQIQE